MKQYLSAFLAASTPTALWKIQKYLEKMDQYFGRFWTAFNYFSLFQSGTVEKIQKYLQNKRRRVNLIHKMRTKSIISICKYINIYTKILIIHKAWEKWTYDACGIYKIS